MSHKKERTIVSWSTGKDSAWSLYQLQQDATIELVGLFCTINEVVQRTAMHAVRIELLQKQAEMIGLPLQIIPIPWPCTNEQYEQIMGRFIGECQEEQIDCFAFGDLYLEDIRAYREKQLQGTGIKPIFPIWGIPTDQLAEQMLAGGIRSILTCVDPKQLSAEFVGREWNQQLLSELPDTVDPCGENGEFHTFTFASPSFKEQLTVEVGEKVERDQFWFADLTLLQE